MSLLKNWCTVDEAESKLGIKRSLILKWVEEGIVRCEEEDGKVVRVNMDDLELKVAERMQP
ncbi:MAG TPA: MerR family transcriptional regulator [Geobacteraceae bacterium]|jgi:predicted site-specific integrase-resolvase|nr:MerR family transcriptional regulator [Geobacteraceae bacterium]